MGFFDLDGSKRDLGHLTTRVQRLEELVAELARRNDMSQAQVDDVLLGGPEVVAEARQLKQQGKAIEAIRLVRARTGLGLKEAKDRVEGL